jgi:hypothetical protein
MIKTFKLASGLHYTYRKTNQGMSIQVLLPNGRNVELRSKEGTDEFVDAVGANFISTNLTAADDQEPVCLPADIRGSCECLLRR